MTRKKSRKIGQIGIPKVASPRPVKTDKRPKSKTGNKSGTRQLIAEAHLALNKKDKDDPKLGSKKAIDLSKYSSEAKAKSADNKAEKEAISFKTPQEELDAIENDTTLDALLEKQENGKLTASERAYVEKKTLRYRDLCQLMGIDVDDYSQDPEERIEQEDDPFAKLDAIRLDDYKE